MHLFLSFPVVNGKRENLGRFPVHQRARTEKSWLLKCLMPTVCTHVNKSFFFGNDPKWIGSLVHLFVMEVSRLNPSSSARLEVEDWCEAIFRSETLALCPNTGQLLPGLPQRYSELICYDRKLWFVFKHLHYTLNAPERIFTCTTFFTNHTFIVLFFLLLFVLFTSPKKDTANSMFDCGACFFFLSRNRGENILFYLHLIRSENIISYELQIIYKWASATEYRIYKQNDTFEVYFCTHLSTFCILFWLTWTSCLDVTETWHML